ncbi:neoverrucotoxin subunit alpha-like [Hypomesus transpacificus]|uniref:neoverrucotoxin subunit alpha-like n=1 Tax=Hypomesus transpacificus TaxID=137520 RepID=UPI001F07C656|nr:neoverrucotoxin subunit alpha-like [Hypomesus transpacificus]
MLTQPGFWRILLLLHTANCVTRTVITPVQQITVVVGESVVLPCYVDPSLSAEGWTVEWLKLSVDRDQRNIHLYKDGRDDNENQNPSFKARTTLFKEELKTAEGSQPVVSIEGHRGAGIGLVCETQGWYPEPEVEWQDKKSFKAQKTAHYRSKFLFRFWCSALTVAHLTSFTDRLKLKKDACELTLDPKTAHRYLSLSEENRKVIRKEEQPYPDHPERFEECPQVLCREGLSGCCYWEAERREGCVDIAVTYKGISRRGKSEDCWLGYNNKSWSLYCGSNSYAAWHNNKKTDIPVPPSSSHRVGVYLNCPAGTLSFYTVSSDTLTHLHTFHSTFTELLYPGFGVYTDSSVSLCQVE